MKAVIHASMFLVNEQDELLLVQEGKEKVRGLWNLPGGKMEHSEQLPEAAVREALEETGLTANPSHLLAVFTSNTDDTDYIHFVFLAKEYSGTMNISDPTILNVQWMPLSTIESMNDDQLLNSEKIHHSSRKYEAGDFIDVKIISHV